MNRSDTSCLAGPREYFAGFGTLWLWMGLAAMYRLNLVSGIVAAVVLALLVIPAVRVLRATSGAVQGDPEPEARMSRKRASHEFELLQEENFLNYTLLISQSPTRMPSPATWGQPPRLSRPSEAPQLVER